MKIKCVHLFLLVSVFVLQANAQVQKMEFPAKNAKWKYTNERMGSAIKTLEVTVVADSVPALGYHEDHFWRHYIFQCNMYNTTNALVDSFFFTMAKQIVELNKPDSFTGDLICLVKKNGANYTYIPNYIYSNYRKLLQWHAGKQVSSYFAAIETNAYGWQFVDSFGCYKLNNKAYIGYKYTKTPDYTFDTTGFCMKKVGYFLDRIGNLSDFMVDIDTCFMTQLGRIKLLQYSDDDLGTIGQFTTQLCAEFNLHNRTTLAQGRMQIAPNPVNSGSRITLGGINGPYTYQIINSQGKTLAAGNTEEAIEIRMNAGVYYLRAISEKGGLYVQKLVVH